jgi:hypothetical protein
VLTLNEPEGDGILLRKSGTKVLVWCDCGGDAQCPQGKIGAQTRCRVWIDRSHMSEGGIDHQKRMNRFDR